ncbi:Bestrophin, RFP-TM, chloride channel-domain-containing protein [Crepidotus variabilis]|uniref:Bestrophin, RFP-TM, chloride channel-domain-containing protein n=1 Tax=Crepidotus variabilis TaxID=179855 RepID=A0A9P6JT06_9AGAR|nr:Bestrophin, RFP-TM, chloride channel-domain-containing protein [Crepidotus variabilis]
MAQPTEPLSPVSRAETFRHQGFAVPDPFAPQARHRPGSSFFNALLATALFRCWHILIFFAGWSTLITILNRQGHKLFFNQILLTVVGTVLGFIISYRTTSSFERYNEGRRLWSQIILACRTLARTIWFHVPHHSPAPSETLDQAKSRTLIEKKSAINLLEAFAVSIKHYLRGEDGIYYQDLYYLVKFLPAYALPAGMPSTTNLADHEHIEDIAVYPETPTSSGFKPSIDDIVSTPDGMLSPTSPSKKNVTISSPPSKLNRRNVDNPTPLPTPVSIGSPGVRGSFLGSMVSPRSEKTVNPVKEKERLVLPRHDEGYLMPSSMPPRYSLFDLFPFSLLVKFLTKKGKDVSGKKGAKLRAKMKKHAVSHNLPLELSLYLSSYIASLQSRKVTDVPTTNLLLASLNQLVDSLTGLERILTTPIPFSYSVHLWVVTSLYCLFLPFQIYQTLGWLTIPATIIISFVFFGFMVAGEEIENPFGYDKNDLNLDHFTHNIIRNEMKAITSTPPPDPAHWAFVLENNLLFSHNFDERVSPAEWMARGPNAMLRSLNQL